jgi:hypothetical protein
VRSDVDGQGAAQAALRALSREAWYWWQSLTDEQRTWHEKEIARRNRIEAEITRRLAEEFPRELLPPPNRVERSPDGNGIIKGAWSGGKVMEREREIKAELDVEWPADPPPEQRE